jgi:hypothetical protein
MEGKGQVPDIVISVDDPLNGNMRDRSRSIVGKKEEKKTSVYTPFSVDLVGHGCV